MQSYPHRLTVLVVRGIEGRVGVGLNMGYGMDLLVLLFIWICTPRLVPWVGTWGGFGYSPWIGIFLGLGENV
jgi:hypothetical protein